ncbi:MAG: hypothetical protein KAJ46_08880, partial [Sedimentisphaerales bacterium]|nr:hypothetical protein [Sedimentisphaerales bacterium]
HVINRGNNRAEIFHKDQDYLRFTEMMGKTVERQPMRILSRKKHRTPLTKGNDYENKTISDNDNTRGLFGDFQFCF